MYLSLLKKNVSNFLKGSFFILLFTTSSQAFATHFRGGTLNWQQNGGNSIKFTLNTSWRLGYYTAIYGTLQVGSTITLQGGNGNDNIYFGDNTSSVLNVTVVSIDVAADIVNTSWTGTHTYSRTGNFIVNALNDGNRFTTTDGNQTIFNLQTIVNVGGPPFNNPPTSSLPSIINLSVNQPNATFTIPASDPDGDKLVFRISKPGIITNFSDTLHESGLTTAAPTGFSLASNGVATFNTVGKTVGTLYAVQVMVLDGKTKTAVDFMIKMVNFAPAPVFISPTPLFPNNVFNVVAGNSVSFTIAAKDPNLANAITLNPVSVPVGSTMSPTLPVTGPVNGTVSSTFNWTPNASQVGTYVITFVAQNAVGVQTNTSVTIHVQCALTASVTTTAAPCPQSNDGSASAAVFNYSTLNNLSYLWTGPDNFTATTQNIASIPVGTYKVKVNDNGTGCFTTATQNVVFKDVTPPVQPTLADVTGECSATADAPTTTDNCSGTITGTTTDALTYNTQGTHTITWTFDDGNGNTTTAAQDLVIKDVTPPVKPTLADVTGECSATAGAPTTTDNCSGTITGTTTDALTYNTQGTHTITWTFDDGNGNTTAATQDVVIKDVTPPVKPTLADVTGECSATASAPTTTDNCSGTITGTTTDALTYKTQGTHTITWTFDDGNENTTTAAQDVVIKDVIKPSVTSCAPVQNTSSDGNCSGKVPDFTANVSATDNCTIASKLVITQAPTAGTSVSTGSTPVTITVTDAAGNFTTCSTSFTVTDNTKPAINCPANIVLSACQSIATWATPTATDNCSNVTVSQTAGPASGSTFTNGTATTITYTATDASNNKTTCSFTVARAAAIGIAVSKTNASCSGQANGSITITASGGAGSYQYKINTGTSYQTGKTFSNLAPGNYTITVKDADNCTAASANVTISSTLTITATISAPPITCYGSKTTLTAIVSGGKASYQYKLINGSTGATIVNYQSNKSFSAAAGTYKVSVKDCGGCEAISNTLIISQPSVLTAVKTSQTNVTCKGGSDGKVTISASGGKSPYQYKINTRSSYQSSGTFSGLSAGCYSITVKDANNCCTAVSNITITQPSKGCTKAAETYNITEARPTDTKIADAAYELNIKVSPNPSSNYFTLITQGNNEKPVEIRVMDIFGRSVYTTKGSANETYRFGERFIGGTYIIEVIQDKLIKTVKVIKGN